MLDLKINIEESLKNIKNKNLREESINFFKVLGYESNKVVLLNNKNEFLENFDIDDKFNKENALFDEWKDVEILFQYTSDEITHPVSKTATPPKRGIKEGRFKSYLFIAVSLEKQTYTKTQLSKITREINKLFLMPVLLIFNYGNFATFSIMDRRLNKKDFNKDVLEKITLIKDINLINPHRAHIEILFELSLYSDKLKAVSSFDELHKKWKEILNISELNKRFYREISNWYFWAMREVYFPDAPVQAAFGVDALLDAETREHNAKNLIRLLTRILFVWFIKEKNLISNDLFDRDFIENDLLEYSNYKEKDSLYYKAVLQNLFFATLNQGMDKRGFRKDSGNMNITNLMRYKKYFKDSDNFLTLIKDIPFMNGGLFECLDKPHPSKKGKQGGDVIIYIDGFSDRKDNKLKVPDYIFFGTKKHVDLSDDYEDNRKKDLSVKGLIDILNSYKFTIDENTPLEEDIALDPELLGKVFENLLASYNPETSSSARKETGSFYTPREIVNFMVDESLISHFKNDLGEVIDDGEVLNKKLHQLLSYNETQPFKTEEERKLIIKSLDNCKILDPACGSGAFPMGILQKMVHILSKVDPHNGLWEDLQISKIDENIKNSKEVSEKKELEALKDDIIEAFVNNEANYPRKLFLIENSIYGVDIQPIAIQISKLRFFISLIVDQRIDKNKENLGIKPLPNLESKFVTANTLISIEKMNNSSIFHKGEIKRIEKELKKVKHKLFSAKTPKTKKKLREEDKELRKQIANMLEEGDLKIGVAKQLADWDPYDQNHSSSFFDKDWMFGLSDGFDIVIGNPPFIRQERIKDLKPQLKALKYKVYNGTADIFTYFFEKGYDLLKKDGVLTFITSNKYTRAKYGKDLRTFFLDNTEFLNYIDFNGVKVFESATVDTAILNFKKSKHQDDNKFTYVNMSKYKLGEELNKFIEKNKIDYDMKDLNKEGFSFASIEELEIKKRIEEVGTPLKDWNIKANFGIKTGLNEAFIIDGEKRKELIEKEYKSRDIIKPILRGKDIKKYTYQFADKWLINTHNNPSIEISSYLIIKEHLDSYYKKLEKRSDQGVTPYNLRSCAYLKQFETNKISWQRVTKEPMFCLVNKGVYILDSMAFIVSDMNNYIISILNSKVQRFYIDKITHQYSNTGYLLSNQYVERLPIPQIPKEEMLPFEIMVDCILFAKENNLETEAEYFEFIIDSMVYDLYFEEVMKKNEIYITDRVKEKIAPFKDDDTDEFKFIYVKALYEFFRKDDEIQKCLIYKRVVKEVRIIEGLE